PIPPPPSSPRRHVPPPRPRAAPVVPVRMPGYGNPDRTRGPMTRARPTRRRRALSRSGRRVVSIGGTGAWSARHEPQEGAMSRTVKGALLQTGWSGDQESMIDKHEEAAREASAQGAEVICFQELFYGPYFCQVQDPEYYGYTEPIPDGPTTKRFQSVAKELGMVMVLPMYEFVQAGQDFNTPPGTAPDGTYLGRYRKQHIPQVKGFWEKFYFTPGTEGYPVFETAVGKVGVYICYDRHFPEGWRILGLHGAEIVFNPSATHRGLSEYIWRLEQPAAAVAN